MEYKDFINYSSTLNILLVEDDMSFCNETKELLELFFRRVDTASNGSDGLKQYKNFYLDADKYYDIVITDINMPLMDGEEFIKEIQFINKTQEVVVISAYSEPAKLINFIKLGIKDFLLKPVNSKDLEESLYKISKKINENASKKCKVDVAQEKFDTKLKELDILSDDEGIYFDNL